MFTLDTAVETGQGRIEKFAERRMKNTGESRAVAATSVIAAIEKLKKNDN